MLGCRIYYVYLYICDLLKCKYDCWPLNFFYVLINQKQCELYWIISGVKHNKSNQPYTCLLLVTFEYPHLKRLGSWLEYIDWLIDWFIVFKATFKNVSAISWQLVLVVEEPESPEITTDHDEATSKLLSLAMYIHMF
jgi:hypothetical protein